MRPISELPIKVGKTYYVARHQTGFGAHFVTLKVLRIKEGKLTRWVSPKSEYWSIETIILDNPCEWGGKVGVKSWIHHEGIKYMKSRWLNIDGTAVIEEG